MRIRKYSLLFLITAVIVTGLLFFLSRDNTGNHEPILSLGLIDQPVPPFNLPTLNPANQPLTNQPFKGRVTLLNVWATWCHACRFEHAFLMEIKNKYHVPMYSINYNDNAASAESWLEKAGNPYVMTGLDPEGDLTDKLDIAGTPQMFIIDSHGIIRYRYLGPINEAIWQNELWPIIQKYQREKS